MLLIFEAINEQLITLVVSYIKNKKLSVYQLKADRDFKARFFIYNNKFIASNNKKSFFIIKIVLLTYLYFLFSLACVKLIQKQTSLIITYNFCFLYEDIIF